MNTPNSDLKSAILLDSDDLKRMGFIEMVTRIEQMRATGRFTDIHIDYRLGAVVAEVLV